MKILIFLLAVFFLSISGAPLPDESAAKIPATQKQEQNSEEQSLAEDLTIKNIKIEEQRKKVLEQSEPETRSVPDNLEQYSQEKNIEQDIEKKIETKLNNEKNKEVLPVEGKKIVEEIKLEEPKALPVEEKKSDIDVADVKPFKGNARILPNEKEPSIVPEEKILNSEMESEAIDKQNLSTENNQIIESKSVSFDESSKNELDSGNKKLSENINEKKDEKLIKNEQEKEETIIGPESESKREEKKVEENQKSKEDSNKSADAKSYENATTSLASDQSVESQESYENKK